MFQTRVLSDLSPEEIRELLKDMGCDKRGIEIMAPKADMILISAKGLDSRGANILKQEFLSAGGEVAVPWEALDLSEEKSDILMMGTPSQYERVKKKLKEQPFDLPKLAEEMDKSIKNYYKKSVLPWDHEGCQIMGVLNVTPDSFYDGGEYNRVEKAVERGVSMAEKGADIIDIGGESTRPGSKRISVQKEMERILPVIEDLDSRLEILLSVDTYKPEVAEEAVKAGADVVNDVFGLRKEGMAEKIAELDVPVIIMHMQGEPKNMQKDPQYEDVLNDISSYFYERIKVAKDRGIREENIILDPGIGFGKKLQHNLEIIDRLDELCSIGPPIVLGASRKSFLGEVLGKKAENRLYGSLAVAALAVEKGVSILRVHDVMETKDVVKTVESLERFKIDQ
ncbi:MAG: dihydropteroate synthase [Candidatus Thermoplasmatota archaeon]|nr:dihydropteroate synthase [Candidatus Thermoplasmatota archaeon]MBS3790154.1 dihydropteroate synthase [Candidatus Thermoplasmatota archaeon]